MPDNSEPRSDTSDSAEAIIPANYNTDEYIYPRSTHLPSIFEAPTDTIPLNKGTLRTITDSWAMHNMNPHHDIMFDEIHPLHDKYYGISAKVILGDGTTTRPV